jgi:hypothetical protein
MPARETDTRLPRLQAEISEAAQAVGLSFTEAQIAKIAGAVIQLRESAARVRTDLSRNDEPAFGFRHPPAPGDTE